MPTWPATLPQEVEAGGFDETLVGARSGSGSPFVRSGVVTEREDSDTVIRCAILVTTAQWRTLQDFISTDIANGALAFDFPAIDGSSAVRAIFTGAPTLSSVGGSFHRAEFNLRILA